MPILKPLHRASLILLCLAVGGTELLRAQAPKTWWPDPTSGLMWTEQAVGLGWKATAVTLRYGLGLTWQDATHYCAALKLEGHTDWRLPTVNEVDAIIFNQQILNEKGMRYVEQEFKGRISGPITTGTIWTSTLSGTQEGWTVTHGLLVGYSANATSLLTDKAGVVCVSSMEADLLQLAHDALVVIPVSDITTLKANVPLTQARLAYLGGNYEESVTQSHNALLLKPDFAQAYWGLGISYGRLGEWDLAVTNLQIAHKLDKHYDDATNSLRWATQSAKAAKSGKATKQPPPTWNWTLEPTCSERWINGNLACASR